ncbi:ABC transporter ATP-binding protein/permease [Pseudomaricurvus sp.]|uniref:ABC transporter ATP-binding protein/permease n=1 Tax=Pseudomaricurvus sp. TaxID=2004510 RepID=UPI003F6B2778
MPQQSSLLTWFNRQVARQGVAPGRTLWLLTGLKCGRALALILAFWFIADILAGWITVPSLSSPFSLISASICLLLAWVLQGAHLKFTYRAKALLLGELEQRLMDQFVRQQHALIRHHSSYYWQTLWMQHLPALVDWRYDYLVQQRVASVMPVITLLAVACVNPVIAGGLLLTLPVVPLFMIIVGKGAASLHRKHFVALERLGGLFVDRLKALPLLATFQGYSKQQTLLQQASEQLNQRTMKVVGVAFLSSTVLDFFSTLAVALVAVFIGFSLLGEISIGTPVALHSGLWILLTVPMLLSEMKLLGQYYHQKAQAEAAQHEVQDLLVPVKPVSFQSTTTQSTTTKPIATQSITTKAETTHTQPAPSKPPAFAGLDLSGFTLQDPDLQADCLQLNPGDWVRLDGASGAGKTVFLEALCGFRGQLDVLSQHRLPAGFVMISQQVVILPYSLRDNLSLHLPVCDEALWQVLDQVGLTHWARALPQQLDTLMGEHPPLSGGEAQRLAIARMLLQDAEVWLLDEPTAHLSESQHRAVADVLHTCCADKTVIWASHKALPETWFNQCWQIQRGRISA